MSQRYLIPALLILTGLSGCSIVPEQPAVPQVQMQPEKVKVPLEEAVNIAVASTLELRVLESLQRIAKEHVEKKRLLDLPGMIYDLPRRLPEFSVENDFRLYTLDHALDACRLLTSPAKENLAQIQTPVEKKKISLEQGTNG